MGSTLNLCVLSPTSSPIAGYRACVQPSDPQSRGNPFALHPNCFPLHTQGIRRQFASALWLRVQTRDGFGQVIRIVRFKEFDRGVAMIQSVDPSSRNDHGDANCHEFHNLGAGSFAAENGFRTLGTTPRSELDMISATSRMVKKSLNNILCSTPSSRASRDQILSSQVPHRIF